MDPLSEYVKEICSLALGSLKIDRHNVRHFGGISAVVIHRRGDCQCELVTVAPAFTAEPHRHPHIDAYELPIAGELTFCIGTRLDVVEAAFAQARAIPVLPWMAFRVRPDDWHAARAGTHGAVFLSVQRWIGRLPSAAGLDWVGEALNEEHAQLLGAPR